MTKLSKKSMLLFAAVLSLSAFALPSMASATSWGPLGTAHTLTSTNLAFTVPAVAAGSICTNSRFHADVAAVASTTLTITAATFAGCTGTGSAGTGCTATATATNLDWAATGISTSNVTIDRVDVDVVFAGSCMVSGSSVRVTGNLAGGVFTTAGHEVVYTNATGTGLTAHIPGLGSFPATVSGTIRDDQQTLTL
jgi:hypothetical protein